MTFSTDVSKIFVSFWTFPSFIRIDIPDTYKPTENSLNIPRALHFECVLFRSPLSRMDFDLQLTFAASFTVFVSHFILPFQFLVFVCMNDLFLGFIGLLEARNLVYNSKKDPFLSNPQENAHVKYLNVKKMYHSTTSVKTVSEPPGKQQIYLEKIAFTRFFNTF